MSASRARQRWPWIQHVRLGIVHALTSSRRPQRVRIQGSFPHPPAPTVSFWGFPQTPAKGDTPLESPIERCSSYQSEQGSIRRGM